MSAPINLALAEIARIATDLDALIGDDEQCFADMIEGETNLVEIVSRLYREMAADEELVAGITERQADLAARKKRIADRIIVRKAGIGRFLRAAKLAKLELPEVTLSVRDGKPTLVVVDADAVPDDLRRIKSEPDKPAINTAYADADALPNWLVREPARDVVSGRVR